MPAQTIEQAAAGRGPVRDIQKGATGGLVANRPFSLAYRDGNPRAFDVPSSGVSGNELSQTGGAINGALPFDDGAGAIRNEILRMVFLSSAQAGRLFLLDRIWHNSGLSVTSNASQSVDSVAFPARDETETSNGVGFQMAMEVVTATGTGVPTHTITYTNADNVGGLTATISDTYAASSAAGSFYRCNMADWRGVKSIQSYQASGTMTSGSISLVVYRVLASMFLDQAAAPRAIDWLTGGASGSIPNGACPFLVFVPTGTASTIIAGDLQFTRV